MVNISDRLRLISDIIGTDSSFADIGTDHGHLAVEARAKGNNNKMVLTDLSVNSLDKAVKNCSGLDVDFRPGNGISVIDDGEVDDIVIAGMGGILISLIIEADLPKARSFKKLILQPRNKSGYLRQKLSEDGFHITGDKLVREGKYICNVIVAEPGAMTDCPDKGDIMWEVPFEISDRLLFDEYIDLLISREKKILNGLKQSTNASDDIDVIMNNIEVLEGILNDKE